jgi:hypothetical protein
MEACCSVCGRARRHDTAPPLQTGMRAARATMLKGVGCFCSAGHDSMLLHPGCAAPLLLCVSATTSDKHLGQAWQQQSRHLSACECCLAHMPESQPALTGCIGSRGAMETHMATCSWGCAILASTGHCRAPVLPSHWRLSVTLMQSNEVLYLF